MAIWAQLLERLIKQDGVKYMLGPYSSATTKAAAPITEKYKVPMVEAEGASRSLFTQGYKYLFAVLSTSEQYLASSVALAAEIAKNRPRRFFRTAGGLGRSIHLQITLHHAASRTAGLAGAASARRSLPGLNG